MDEVVFLIFGRFCLRALSVIVLCCVLGVASINRLNGQAATATIQGTVTDSTGAAIPDATVQVKNVGTSITQSTTSDAQGRFNVPDLGIGEYEAQTSKAGFSTVVHRGITLTVGAQAVVDFSLPVGQQTQTVTVEGEASQVDVSNSAVSSLISGTQMSELSR